MVDGKKTETETWLVESGMSGSKRENVSEANSFTGFKIKARITIATMGLDDCGEGI